MKGITVWTAFYNVLRAYNMTTIFSNPGSTGKLEEKKPSVETLTYLITLYLQSSRC